MVNNPAIAARLNDTFAALAHPMRRGILERLSEGEAPVGTLAGLYRVTPPAITKHLRILEEAGLISRRKEGRILWCSVEGAPMKEITDWIEHYRRFWTRQLDGLELYLKENRKKKK